MLLNLAGLATAAAAAASTVQIPIKNYRDQVYMISLKVGTQNLSAVLDTGSSDTWFADADFKCTGAQPCNFGPAYDRAKSKSFSPLAGQNFSIAYASENLSGGLGLETLGFGDVKVEKQLIGVVKKGAWKGDGMSSGLLGMGFPSGSAVWYDLQGPQKVSTPFTSMVGKGLIEPVFSIALNGVDEGPGVLTLGGLPSGADVKFNGSFATTKMLYLVFDGADPAKKPKDTVDPGRYRVGVENFIIDGKLQGKAQVNIDTGTAASILPRDLARQFNAGWVPKASFDRVRGWTVNCTAKPPSLGIKLGGTVFNVPAKDLVTPPEDETWPKGTCGSAVQEGASFPGSSLLGANFLKSVVAVFDVGKMEMRFAPRIRP